MRCKTCEKVKELLERIRGKDDWRERERMRWEYKEKDEFTVLCPKCHSKTGVYTSDFEGERKHIHECGNCGWESKEFDGQFHTLSESVI